MKLTLDMTPEETIRALAFIENICGQIDGVMPPQYSEAAKEALEGLNNLINGAKEVLPAEKKPL